MAPPWESSEVLVLLLDVDVGVVLDAAMAQRIGVEPDELGPGGGDACTERLAEELVAEHLPVRLLRMQVELRDRESHLRLQRVARRGS